MTRQVSEYSHLQNDNLQDYVERMQDIVTNLLETFYFTHQKLDELNFKRLSLETFTGETLDEAESHFISVLNDFRDCCKAHLINRIQKGEEFLSFIGKDDPRYRAAENKLVNLINELAEYEG